MIEISVSGDTVLATALENYPARVNRAVVRALNRGIAGARTVMVREVARDTGLKSTDVRAALPMTQASLNHPEATVRASMKRIPLIDFTARGPEPSRGRGRGVTYRLSGSRNRVPNAFIATMASGHRGVFVRAPGSTHKSAGAWSKNLPLKKELEGPSLGHVFAKYRPLALARAKELFETNLAHEIDFRESEQYAETRSQVGLDV